MPRKPKPTPAPPEPQQLTGIEIEEDEDLSSTIPDEDGWVRLEESPPQEKRRGKKTKRQPRGD